MKKFAKHAKAPKRSGLHDLANFYRDKGDRL
ncbi:hypothetical protein COPEUT_03012 [Coprococcus eutactus ATCC 27759]|nr:hypothetical protein COPEUT_03012 [Coprococcus eutactus ATCC 27759]